MASGGHSSSRCAGLSLSWPLLLRSTGSRRACSVIVAHGPSCSAACGIFPDQDSNPCPCIGRQILNHCTTREALIEFFIPNFYGLKLCFQFQGLNIPWTYTHYYLFYSTTLLLRSETDCDTLFDNLHDIYIFVK